MQPGLKGPFIASDTDRLASGRMMPRLDFGPVRRARHADVQSSLNDLFVSMLIPCLSLQIDGVVMYFDGPSLHHCQVKAPVIDMGWNRPIFELTITAAVTLIRT